MEHDLFFNTMDHAMVNEAELRKIILYHFEVIRPTTSD